MNSEEPMEVDFLIKAFRSSSEEILDSFNGLKVNEEFRDFYGEKLEKYIGEKEKIVL